MLKRLWNDECGALISGEFVLVATILVIGVIVGLKSVRDAVVTELADVGQAISEINQSYSYSGVSGHHVFTAGSFWHDNRDYCDDQLDNNDGSNGRCVVICGTAARTECN